MRGNRQQTYGHDVHSRADMCCLLWSLSLSLSEVSNRVLSGKSFVPACKYILTRWYVCLFVYLFICPRVVNPSSGLGGLEGRQKMSVILSVILSVRLFVCPRLPGGPGRQSPDFSPQSFSVPP